MERDYIGSEEQKLIDEVRHAAAKLSDCLEKSFGHEPWHALRLRVAVTHVENFVRMQFKLDHLPKKEGADATR